MMSEFNKERGPGEIGNGLGIENTESDAASLLSKMSSNKHIGKLNSM